MKGRPPKEASLDVVTGMVRHLLPDDWFVDDVEVSMDRDEILVVGRLADVPGATGDAANDVAATDEAPETGVPEDADATSDVASDDGSTADDDPEQPSADHRRARRRRIEEFRETTRRRRIEIARELEATFNRKVAWGARCGDVSVLFTHLSIPAMTRLRLRERLVLDTLIDAGVARSRSEALAWCVRLVGRHERDWLDELREALTAVEEVRRRGPG